MQITAEQVRAIGGSRANPAICAMIADFINGHGHKYRLDTPLRVQHFLGQTAWESTMFSRLRESLNYSVSGLMKTFGRHRISAADARRFGRIKGKRRAKQEAIANAVYGGGWGRENLGNIERGDGWLHIGRSIKQVTGRYNVAQFNIWIHTVLPDAPDFSKNPQLLETLEWAVWPAVWYWVARECWKFADRDDCAGLTKRINGGTKGLKQRASLTRKAGRVLGMKDMPRVTKRAPRKRDPLLRETQTRLGKISVLKGDPALDPGAADGWNGKRTKSAVEAFQTAYSLDVDGIAGPKTRARIEAVLEDLEAPEPVIVETEVLVEKDKPVVPEEVETEVKKKTGFWGWVSGLLSSGAAGVAGLFGADWQTVAVIVGGGVLVLIIGLLLRNQIIDAVKQIRGELEAT